MTRGSVSVLLFFCIVLCTGGCSELSPFATYSPPILPICFTISPEGITVSGQASFVTPVGVFTVGTSYPLASFGADDLVLVLRNKRTGQDHVYVIQQGRHAQIVLDGHISMVITTDSVTVDITDAQKVEVRYFCPLEIGQKVRMKSHARLWPGPTVANSDFIATLPERGSYYVLTGPILGRIRSDKDISGWWWEVSETRDGTSVGWIWEGRITQCNYRLD